MRRSTGCPRPSRIAAEVPDLGPGFHVVPEEVDHFLSGAAHFAKDMRVHQLIAITREHDLNSIFRLALCNSVRTYVSIDIDNTLIMGLTLCVK
jgi:hypothetical protein